MAKPLKVKKIAAAQPAARAAARILRARLAEFYSHWPEAATLPTPTELHNLRISGKRLRYSAENLRGFYPDRLALLIELLKRGQDILGEYQDCVTQQALLAKDLARQRQRHPESSVVVLLEKLLAELHDRQQLLFQQFQEIWHGLARPEFRICLKAMVKDSTAQLAEREAAVAEDIPASAKSAPATKSLPTADEKPA